jgi:hypothetical protein
MTKIFITTRFEGFHCWPDAPDEVAFLRSPHRHIFHVRCWRTVDHDDRDIEFIQWKRQIDFSIRTLAGENDTMKWSCETWARAIGGTVDADTVEVSEDGENGAVWIGGERLDKVLEAVAQRRKQG